MKKIISLMRNKKLNYLVSAIFLAFLLGKSFYSLSNQPPKNEKEFKAKAESMVEKTLKNLAEWRLALFEQDLKKLISIAEDYCDEGNYKACEELRLLEHKVGDELVENKKLCRSGTLQNCFEAGLTLKALGRLEDAAVWFKKGCDSKIYTACNEYAKVALEDEPQKREEIFGEACSNGVGEACLNLAKQEKERHKAYQLSDMACGIYGVRDGCAFYSEMLLEEENEKSVEMGIENLKVLCEEKNKRSCYVLGRRLKKSEDYKKALGYFKEGCRLGDIKSCNIGDEVIEAIELEKIKLGKLGKTCAKQDGKACYEAGMVDIGVNDSAAQAAEWFVKACDFGDVRGCPIAINHFYRRGDQPKLVVRLLERGCELKDTKSCLEFSTFLIFQKNTESIKRGREIASTYCDQKDKSFCSVLFVEQVVSGERKKGLQSLDELCQDGIENACFFLQQTKGK